MNKDCVTRLTQSRQKASLVGWYLSECLQKPSLLYDGTIATIKKQPIVFMTQPHALFWQPTPP
jgi:hypothetical protein